MLPPYNEHLVSDVDELCVGFSLLHFQYHVTHLDGWDLGDLVQPLAAAVAVRPRAGGG